LTDTTGSPLRGIPSKLIRDRAIGLAAAAFGAATPFLNNMPIIDATAAGLVVSFALIGVGMVLVVWGFPTIGARLAPGERLFLAGFLAAVTLASLAGLASGVNPEPATLIKLIVLSTLLYFAAKLLQDSDGVDRYLRWFYYLCVFAAVQAIVAAVVGVLGLRQIGLIDLSGGGDRYVLSWWGLLGGDNGSFRTNFYFSEPSYFAQMLIPAIFFAYATKRWLGVAILLVGLMTTVAFSSSIAFLFGFTVLILRRGLGLASLTIAAIGAAVILGALNFLADNRLIYVQLFVRGKSVADKFEVTQLTLSHLADYPLGIGAVDLHNRYGAYVNTANGMFDLAAQLGFPGLVCIFSIGLYLAYLVFRPGGNREVAAIAIGLGSLILAGATHGPFLKYFAIFMLSALVLKASSLAGARATAA
jgi:hypothetical protein